MLMWPSPAMEIESKNIYEGAMGNTIVLSINSQTRKAFRNTTHRVLRTIEINK